MKKNSILLILILPFFTNFKPRNEEITPFVCVSSYSILNSNTNSSNIVYADMIGNWCDYGVNPPNCGSPYYSEAQYIPPGTQYDIETNTFSTEATTTGIRIILTTSTSFIGRMELYINGNLVKTNQEIIASTTHGITYTTSFYCSTVLVKLTN